MTAGGASSGERGEKLRHAFRCGEEHRATLRVVAYSVDTVGGKRGVLGIKAPEDGSVAAQAGHAANPVFYAILGLAGINYLLEVAVNLVLAPIIVRIIEARQK